MPTVRDYFKGYDGVQDMRPQNTAAWHVACLKLKETEEPAEAESHSDLPHLALGPWEQGVNLSCEG